jgi:diguanylate cyclase (GGDEF)-like protein
MNPDDQLVFSEETLEDEAADDILGSWKLLVVDDDPEVHHATRFALQDFTFQGRRLEMHSVFGAGEANQFLCDHTDTAVVLLDVVMESSDAGLRLVGDIRNRLHNSSVRIILRTGQPGYAPEVEAITEYDINDYKAKAELTHTQLISSITAALRSFDQIRTIETSRRGLERLIIASSQLMTSRTSTSFAEAALRQMSTILGTADDGLVCIEPSTESAADDMPTVIAAQGQFTRELQRPLNELHDERAKRFIEEAFQHRTHVFDRDNLVVYIEGNKATPAALYMPYGDDSVELDHQLIEVFATNLALGLDNATLFETIHHTAFYDELTGLINRHSVLTDADELIKQQPSERLRLVLVDLDHFQQINDGLGHQSGDQVLRQIARRLTSLHPAPCRVARVAGDIFGLLIPDSELKRWRPQQLMSLFAETVEVLGNPLPVGATCGAADYPESGKTANELFTAAGIALKQAKQYQRGSFLQHQEQMDIDLRNRLRTISDLRSAIDQRALRLYYQPQLDIQSGQVIGVEALMRWPQPDGSFISPAEFIPAAEKSGLIAEIGDWVLQEACRQQTEWAQAGHKLRVAVNVSVRQFQHPNFLGTVRRILRESDIDPSQLELEVTESMLMHDDQPIIAQLDELNQMGLTIAVDDFGTGYSSLAYLQRLPVHRLKIDRSFIMQLGDGTSADMQITDMIVNLGHRLQLSIVAEGVEEVAQLNALKAMNCNEAQGFLFSPAIPPDELLGLVDRLNQR